MTPAAERYSSWGVCGWDFSSHSLDRCAARRVLAPRRTALWRPVSRTVPGRLPINDADLFNYRRRGHGHSIEASTHYLDTVRWRLIRYNRPVGQIKALGRGDEHRQATRRAM